MSAYALTGEFTVKAARNAGTKPNPHGGEFVKWYVDLLDSAGQLVKNQAGEVKDAYWQRKPDADVTEGDVVYGTVSEGEYGLRFKMEKRPDGSGPGGGEFSGSRGGGKSPDQQASIVRQHSQEMAIRWFTATTPGRSAATLDELRPVIDWFAEDANAAQTASGDQQHQRAGEDNVSPAAPPQTPPTHQELHGLLEKAGLNSNASRVVTDYALTNMSAEEQDAALSMLGNPDRASAAVKRLSEKAEAHYGSPLPSDDPGDDIPF